MTMRRLAAAAAMTALGLSACGSSGSAQGSVTSSAVRVTRGEVTTVAAGNGAQVAPNTRLLLTQNNEAPFLLRDSGNADTLYLSTADLQSGLCRFYVSTDHGAAWTERSAPVLPPYTDCGLGSVGPQNIRTELAQAPNGAIYYLHHAQDPKAGGARSVILGRSTDGGRNWSVAPVDAAPAATPDNPVQVNFMQHMTIDPANPNRIYVMWRRSYHATSPAQKAPSTRPWMAISDDGGAHFGTPFMMFDKNPGFDGPRPIVVGNRLYAFYRESAPRTPDNAPPQPTKLFASYSTDQGKTWHDTEIAEALDASEPVPLYDRDRKVFDVVWHDNRTKDLDVYFSSSKDGTRWSAPRRLNDDALRNRVGQYYPQIALAPNGRLDVAWYDYRDDSYPPPVADPAGSALDLGSDLGMWQDVYTTHSTDGGKTWTKNLRVDPAVRIDRTKGTWNGQYFVVVPPTIETDNDRTMIAWSDTRDGNAETSAQNIYANQVSYGDTTTPSGSVSDDPGLLALGAIGAALIGAGLVLFVSTATARRRRAAQVAGPPATSTA